jgi:hypothetical protein
MECDWLLRAKRGDEQIEKRLQRVSENLAHTIAFTRQVIDQLWPSIVQHLGFPTALQQQVSDMSSHSGLAVDISVDADAHGIPDDIAVALYRLVQQVLESCADAKTADSPLRIALMRQGDNVTFTIEAAAATGMETEQEDILLLLQERARRAGGQVVVEPDAAGGRSISVSIPSVTRVSSSSR